MNQQMTEDEIFSFDEDPTMPAKSWQEVLAENPHCVGTLVETLALEEKERDRLRSTEEQQSLSKSAP